MKRIFYFQEKNYYYKESKSIRFGIPNKKILNDDE
jgi:hypothetical protein